MNDELEQAEDTAIETEQAAVEVEDSGEDSGQDAVADAA